jgi:hypothetical protein
MPTGATHEDIESTRKIEKQAKDVYTLFTFVRSFENVTPCREVFSRGRAIDKGEGGRSGGKGDPDHRSLIGHREGVRAVYG